MRAVVITHRRRDGSTDAVRELIAAARRAGATLVFDAEEARKHGLEPGEGIELVAQHGPDADLCIVLGGDGTILTALREFAGTDVPVFAVNFGEVGFLATIDPDELGRDFDRAFSGDFERLPAAAIDVGRPEGSLDGDQRRLDPPQAGQARRRPRLRARPGRRSGACAATGSSSPRPPGSTGYNLANGGPVLAWGVRGFVVSFIAPHSLTARALVVAPDDVLTINNASRDEPVDVHVDGRPACELPAGEDIHVEFGHADATLAQLPGATLLPPPARAVRRLAK